MRRFVMSAISAILLVGGMPVVASHTTPLRSSVTGVSRTSVQFGDKVVISGRALAALQSSHLVRVGGREAPASIWTDDRITIAVMPRDPGRVDITIEPRGPGSRVTAGTLTVAKALVPTAEDAVTPGVVLLRLAPSARPESVVAPPDTYERQFPLSDDPELSRWYQVTVPVGQERDRVTAYATNDLVEWAHPSGFATIARAPNDPCFNNCTIEGQVVDQYNVKIPRLTAMWEVQTGQGAINPDIAILDTGGVRATHRDLQTRVVQDLDCTQGGLGNCVANARGTCAAVGQEHGTRVASVASAVTNNGAPGIAGASWGAGVASYRVFDPQQIGDQMECRSPFANQARAVNHATVDGREVINLSIDCFDPDPGCFPDPALQGAIDNASNNGVFIVAAAGNRTTSEFSYPGALGNVMAVANSDQADGRFGSSNWGPWVDIAAPGANIPVADDDTDTDYARADGTSFSAPLVAGVGAVLRRAGLANGTVIYNALMNNADPLPCNGGPTSWQNNRIMTGTGYPCGRRLNAYRALVPSQGCIRESSNGGLAVGSWVRDSTNGRIYYVDQGEVLRYVGHPSVLDTWQSWPDVVEMCTARRDEMPMGAGWGYRPGSVVRDPSTGAWFLISTDGTDRGLPQKRWITSLAAANCYGWQATNVYEGSNGALNTHRRARTFNCRAASARRHVSSRTVPSFNSQTARPTWSRPVSVGGSPAVRSTPPGRAGAGVSGRRRPIKKSTSCQLAPPSAHVAAA